MKLDLDSAVEQQQNLHPKGPWKMHAMVLIIWITLMCFASCPTITTSGHYSTGSTQLAAGSFHPATHEGPTTLGGLLSHQCHSALLLIAGVEPNPGPTPQDGQLPSAEDIMAGLCANAPTTDVRDCLRLYNLGNTSNQHKTAFNKCQKSLLVTTLDYLKKPGQDQFNKSTCVNNLICRVQNLLPDDCNVCEQQYCVRPDDVPLLSCEVCGQGSHDDCILNQFGIPPEEQDVFGPADAVSKLNLSGFPGLHYLCGACEDRLIPDKEAGLLRKSFASKEDSQATQDRTADQNTTVAETETSVLHPPVPQNATGDDDEDDDDEQTEDQTVNHSTSPSAGNNTGIASGNQETGPGTQQNKNICPFYRKGTCRYGLTGRNCPKDHPTPCRKLMKHGNRGPNGCTLGRACEKFHPKMCPTSLTKRQCLREDCKLRHITGTARKDQPKRPAGTAQHTKPQSTPPMPANDSNYFLEALQAMRQEIMTELEHKLTALQKGPPMPATMPQAQPQPLPPQAAAHSWPGHSYPGQMYTMWPRGQAAGEGSPGYGGPMSTTHPMMLVPMALPR